MLVLSCSVHLQSPNAALLFECLFLCRHSLQLFSLNYDLAFHTTHVVCVNLIREFNVDSELQIFFRNFSWQIYFCSQSFCQKSLERKSPTKYFSIFGFIAVNKFADYLLTYLMTTYVSYVLTFKILRNEIYKNISLETSSQQISAKKL